MRYFSHRFRKMALNVASAIIEGLGFEVIYGDTDSVMYSLDLRAESKNLLGKYVEYIKHQTY